MTGNKRQTHEKSVKHENPSDTNIKGSEAVMKAEYKIHSRQMKSHHNG